MNAVHWPSTFVPVQPANSSSQSDKPKYALRSSIHLGLKLALLTLFGILMRAAWARPSTSTAPRTQFAYEGKRVQLKIQAKGTAPLKDQWLFNSTRIRA